MNEATCVLAGGLKEVQVPANGYGLGNLHVPPCVVRAMLVERQHAHCNARLRGIVPPSQRAALVGADLDPVSCLRGSLDVLDATTEDPGVLPADALVAFGFQRDRGKGGGGGIHGAKLTLGFLARPSNPIRVGFDDPASIPGGQQRPQWVPVTWSLGQKPFLGLNGPTCEVLLERLSPLFFVARAHVALPARRIRCI